MGGRGTFSMGKSVAYTYKTVGFVDGVKILQPIDSSKAWKLPEESHRSTGYVLYNKEGEFHQYREYDKNHEVILEIGYHYEPSLGPGKILHVHEHILPGVANHTSAKKYVIRPGDTIYEKYKFLFKGVV